MWNKDVGRATFRFYTDRGLMGGTRPVEVRPVGFRKLWKPTPRFLLGRQVADGEDAFNVAERLKRPFFDASIQVDDRVRQVAA